MGRLDRDPTPEIFNWPVKYAIKHVGNGLSEIIELKALFNSSEVKLVDDNKNSFYITSYKGYTVVGSGRYGGEHTECIFYNAIGSLGKVDLFMVVPSFGVTFTNPRKIKIISPGPIILNDVTITPQPLTMFQQFSFNFLSKRIHNTLKPILQ